MSQTDPDTFWNGSARKRALEIIISCPNQPPKNFVRMVKDDGFVNLGLLDLARGSVIGFDGVTVALQRDDFVGISMIPISSFHFLTVRGGSANSTKSSSPVTESTFTVAFVLPEDKIFCRKFDPQTEEVSSLPVDTVTLNNLQSEIQGNRLNPERVISYDNFISQERINEWKYLTSYISQSLLGLRKAKPGDKIIPGSFETSTQDPTNADGAPLSYPLVPLLGETRCIRHAPTKRYMASLSPDERTGIFMATRPADLVFDTLLREHYNGDYELILGDIQLSFVAFQHLHCYASMEHWRDLLAMLSFVSSTTMHRHVPLYSGLVNILIPQMKAVDLEMFGDGDESDENFLLPAVRRLCEKMHRNGVFSAPLTPFISLLQSRFEYFSVVDPIESDDESDDDDDGPVVVSNEEIEKFNARLVVQKPTTGSRDKDTSIKSDYPLLFAAMMPNEDAVMTCARALDEANDVSLVREAAEYLERVEAIGSKG